MAVVKVGEMALKSAMSQQEVAATTTKPSRKVLDEDTYTENVEKIIVRDFYPDLPKLHAQADFMEALEKNDTAKLREIHIKYGPKRSHTATPGNIYATPSTFETPIEPVKQTPKPTDNNDDSQKPASEEKIEEETPAHNPEKPKRKEIADLHLDKYLSRVTSEDNASFDEIQEESETRRRLKHGWLYDKEGVTKEDQQKMLALPPIEQQAIAENTGQTQGWTYVNKNSLMYPPEGVAESSKDQIEKASKPREIFHKNTRFQENPFNMQKSHASIAEAASVQCLTQAGKIGVDGKEVLPAQSPTVGGYSFMATPSPAPGVDASPLMTWGEIEGTPFRLDGGDTPLLHTTPGPTFKIPDIPHRDRLAMKLADKASAAHRARKEKALSNVKANFTSPSPKFGSSKSSRLSGMSPAAQKLASSKLGIRTHTDKSLRASYTPSPGRHSSKTPTSLTPGSKRKDTVTPKSRRDSTPTSTRSTPKRGTSEVTSLTDNLLNLPKRPKAQDFF